MSDKSRLCNKKESQILKIYNHSTTKSFLTVCRSTKRQLKWAKNSKMHSKLLNRSPKSSYGRKASSIHSVFSLWRCNNPTRGPSEVYNEAGSPSTQKECLISRLLAKPVTISIFRLRQTRSRAIVKPNNNKKSVLLGQVNTKRTFWRITCTSMAICLRWRTQGITLPVTALKQNRLKDATKNLLSPTISSPK